MDIRRFGIAGNLARPFAGLMFLAVLTASASPEAPSRVDGTSLVQVARVVAPPGPDLGLLNRVTLAEPLPLASRPVDEARRDAGSISLEEFSGGRTATLLVAASMIAAVALILAVVFSR